jgi:site-specific DNA-methyltransferase (cytosine-N4-specific)
MPLPLAQWLVETWTQPGDLVLDPFCGSGTTMLAAISRGRHAIGTDMNPIARLIAEVSLGVFDPDFDIAMYADSVAIIGDSQPAPIFPDQKYDKSIVKWFDPQSAEELAWLAGAVNNIQTSNRVKRYLALAFSRTVRRVSRTRQDELKLWTRKSDKPGPYALFVFSREARELLASLIQMKSEISDGEDVGWELRDSEASELDLADRAPDAILTSPPYGDSATTVAYGNFTMLNRIWLSTIDDEFDKDHPASQDRMATGGSLYSSATKKIDIQMQSPLLVETCEYISEQSPKRAGELRLFWDHMYSIFSNLLTNDSNPKHVAVVIGPRTMAGVSVDNGGIVSEIIESLNFSTLFDQSRLIGGKRMPAETKQGAVGVKGTITNERVIVFGRKS